MPEGYASTEGFRTEGKAELVLAELLTAERQITSLSKSERQAVAGLIASELDLSPQTADFCSLTPSELEALHVQGRVEVLTDRLELLVLLRQRLLDSRFDRDLRAGSELEVEAADREAWQSYVSQAEQPVEVFRSYAIGTYLQQGWQVVGGVDLENAQAANQLRTATDRRGGDLLIQRAAQEITARLIPEDSDYKLFNLGGDEFVILAPPGVDFQPLTAEAVELAMAGVEAFYQIDDKVTRQEMGLKVKEDLADFVRDTQESMELSLPLEERIRFLRTVLDRDSLPVFEAAMTQAAASGDQKFVLDLVEKHYRISRSHHAFNQYSTILLEVKDRPDQEKLMNLFWASCEDTINNPTIEKFQQRDLEVMISSSKAEFFHILEQPGHVAEESELEADQRYELIEAIVPRRLKDLNDDPELGYQSGNDMLRGTAERIITVLRDLFPTVGRWRLCREQSVYLIALPNQLLAERPDLTIDVIQDRLAEALSQDLEVRSRKGLRTVPMIGLTMAREIGIEEHRRVIDPMTGDFALLEDNQEVIGQALKQLAGQELTEVGLSYRQRLTEDDRDQTWLMLAAYLKPGKRFEQSRRALGISPELGLEMITRFYPEKAFDPKVLPAFKDFIRIEVLNRPPHLEHVSV